MTNGSQPPGGFEPPRHPLKKNDLDPRLVEKMEKMKHELQACQSLKEEIRGQQQTASRQAPARCQPNSDTQRRLDHAHDTVKRACRLIFALPELVRRMHKIARGPTQKGYVQHIQTDSRNFREEVCFQIYCKDRQTGRKLNGTDCAKSTQKYYDHLWNE